MPGRLGPRFAVEALFLIALAVGAGLADLATRWIVLIMAGGWLIVSLLELTSERLWATVPAWRRPGYPAVAPSPVAEPAPEPEVAPAPANAAAPEPEPEPVPMPMEPAEPEPETVIVSAANDWPDAPVAEPEPEPEPAAEEPARPKLEPLEGRPKRRWFRRGDEPAPEPESEPAPKHVRLLPTTPRQDRITDEVAEIFDTSEREEEQSRR